MDNRFIMTEKKTKTNAASKAYAKKEDQIKAKLKEAKNIDEESAELAAENELEETEQIEKGDIVLACLGYFWILCLLPILLKPESDFCQHHGKQSLCMFIVFMIFSFLLWFHFVPWIWWFGMLFRFIYIVLAIVGIVGAAKGEKTRIPLFAQAAEQLKW